MPANKANHATVGALRVAAFSVFAPLARKQHVLPFFAADGSDRDRDLEDKSFIRPGQAEGDQKVEQQRVLARDLRQVVGGGRSYAPGV